MAEMTEAERTLRECVRLWQNSLDSKGVSHNETFRFQEATGGGDDERGRISRQSGAEKFPVHLTVLQELERDGYIEFPEQPELHHEFTLTSLGKRYGLKLLGRKP